MKTSVIYIASYLTRIVPEPSCMTGNTTRPRQSVAFFVSDQLASRIHFPSHVESSSQASFFPMGERRHAEAVYENTMRYLETAMTDEALSRS